MRKKNSFWKIFIKVLLAIIASIVLLLGILLVVSSISNKSKLEDEKKYLELPGEMVKVDDRDIHVMNMGDKESDVTLVFLHSNKTYDDAVCLQPLIKELDKYNVIYVDRSGIGFSPEANAPKDIKSMVDETRKAVKAVKKDGPYILVPIKSGGLEAMYWANTYPDEVKAVVGLEMYFPDQYADKEDDAYCSIGNYIATGLVSIGAHRYAKDIYPKNDSGIYTEKQMKTRNALCSKVFYTKSMYNEDKELVKNAKITGELGWPEDTKMYLLYANPFLEPYVSENDDMIEINKELAEKDDSYDSAGSYNYYYKDYLKSHKNVTFEELSSPERMITYNNKKLAKKITKYIDSLN